MNFVGSSTVGTNPKINNIFLAYNSSQYKVVWLSDSNILSESLSVLLIKFEVIYCKETVINKF